MDTSVEWTWVGLEWPPAYLVCCGESSANELVDAALGTNYAQDFDLNIDLHSVDVRG